MEGDEDKENEYRSSVNLNAESKINFRTLTLSRLSECGTEDEEAGNVELKPKTKTETYEDDHEVLEEEVVETLANIEQKQVKAKSLSGDAPVSGDPQEKKHVDIQSSDEVFLYEASIKKIDYDANVADASPEPDAQESKKIKCTSNVKFLNDSDKEKKKDFPSVSIFDYIYGELRRGYLLENDEQRFTERREKCYRFFKIPREIEKFIFYGFFQCLDAFLFMFTFLPLRSVLSVWFLVTRSVRFLLSVLFGSHRLSSRILQPAEICDLFKGIIVIIVCFLLTYIDSSIMYHIVKSQSVIKLYIMFTMLEVADKLFSSFGQDILDALYWTATEPRGRKREHIGLLPHFILSVAYVFLHSVIVLLQATTLNVAVNSQNKALLTIMLSNNFVELKSMVFRKFGKDNLFQMSCSDVRERFHYLILLFLVIIQTMKEYNWDEEQFMLLFPYCLGVFVAEVFVDWTKHAFITKFNEISFEGNGDNAAILNGCLLQALKWTFLPIYVYKDYTVSLAYDLVSCKLKNAFSDHSDLISRRMGFIPLPLGALVLRVIVGSIPIVGFFGFAAVLLTYMCLVSAKLWISIVLLGIACNEIEAHRNSQKEKYPTTRQCSSLPSSRHHSSEDLQQIGIKPKSVPPSQSASVSSSLADIAAQVQIRQETIEANPILSNSEVSLINLGNINDNIFVNEQFPLEKSETGERWKATATFGGILRTPTEPLKRRISLQEDVKHKKDTDN